jgi:peptidyl-prolyl cis-trans isomerase A (cyclophilin A)
MNLLLLLLLLAAEPSSERVLVETEAGAIEIEVDLSRAPRTAANFLRYVDAGHYDGGSFFRTVREDNQREAKVPIAVIQGGVPAAREKHDFPPVALERTRDTGLRHVDGTVSMARSGPDSATSSFFVCVGDQPELDFAGRRNPDGQGFAAFGRVVRGMDVVRKIQAGAADGERLAPAVRITKAARIAPARRPSPK